VLKADTVKITQKFVTPMVTYKPWYEKYLGYVGLGLIILILAGWITKKI
jgi:hypothetical protein